MNLEFKVYEINDNHRVWQMLKNVNSLNEFIVVGEEIIGDKEYYKVHQLTDEGMKLIGGLKLNQTFSVEKENLILKTDGLGYETTEINIPKEYLTIDIIDDVQRLNE